LQERHTASFGFTINHEANFLA